MLLAMLPVVRRRARHAERVSDERLDRRGDDARRHERRGAGAAASAPRRLGKPLQWRALTGPPFKVLREVPGSGRSSPLLARLGPVLHRRWSGIRVGPRPCCEDREGRARVFVLTPDQSRAPVPKGVFAEEDAVKLRDDPRSRVAAAAW